LYNFTKKEEAVVSLSYTFSQEKGLFPSRFCYLGVNIANLGAMKYRHQLAYQNVQASYSRLIRRM